MSDASIISGRLPESSSRAEVYKASRDVRVRAAVSQKTDTLRNRKALDRLDLVLKTGRPLDDEVPRGYYLDLKV